MCKQSFSAPSNSEPPYPQSSVVFIIVRFNQHEFWPPNFDTGRQQDSKRGVIKHSLFSRAWVELGALESHNNRYPMMQWWGHKWGSPSPAPTLGFLRARQRNQRENPPSHTAQYHPPHSTTCQVPYQHKGVSCIWTTANALSFSSPFLRVT